MEDEIICKLCGNRIKPCDNVSDGLCIDCADEIEDADDERKAK